jgi:hypothetical protein
MVLGKELPGANATTKGVPRPNGMDNTNAYSHSVVDTARTSAIVKAGEDSIVKNAWAHNKNIPCHFPIVQ